jgi:hypothetical protein
MIPMALDDARLTQLLARDRDTLVEACTLPTANHALLRARLHAARRRAARASAFIDHLRVAGGSLIAVAVAAMLFYVPLSDRVSTVVLGALAISVAAVLSALIAIRATSFETPYRTERGGR